MAAQTDKQRALEPLQKLPDTATVDDAIERFCFLTKIEEGLVKADEVIWNGQDLRLSGDVHILLDNR
jgi:hypothetical protein